MRPDQTLGLLIRLGFGVGRRLRTVRLGVDRLVLARVGRRSLLRLRLGRLVIRRLFGGFAAVAWLLLGALRGALLLVGLVGFGRFVAWFGRPLVVAGLFGRRRLPLEGGHVGGNGGGGLAAGRIVFAQEALQSQDAARLRQTARAFVANGAIGSVELRRGLALVDIFLGGCRDRSQEHRTGHRQSHAAHKSRHLSCHLLKIPARPCDSPVLIAHCDTNVTRSDTSGWTTRWRCWPSGTLV